MNIVFVGCVEFSHSALKKVLALKGVKVVGVITKRRSSFHADFRSLAPLAKKAGIPILFWENGASAAVAEWIRTRHADAVYCFGWSELLKKEILSSTRLGVIGFHPAELPKNRGRHPIIWALVLGLDKTASTFFWMDEGADSGDILDQKTISIRNTDDAASLYRKITRTALGQIGRFTRRLERGIIPRKPQQHASATYWRKRGEEDGRIDWRMPARNICNLVRALTKPYPGAAFLYKGRPVRIWKARIAAAPHNSEPGKVLGFRSRRPWIKCGEDSVVLVKHELGSKLKIGEHLR